MCCGLWAGRMEWLGGWVRVGSGSGFRGFRGLPGRWVGVGVGDRIWLGLNSSNPKKYSKFIYKI